jgi:nitrate reductase assembly molybdenum cofactor insertion protein NarJ
VDPKVEELLTYILSKQGQAQVTREADYLPLTLEVAAHSLEELRRRHTVANP